MILPVWNTGDANELFTKQKINRHNIVDDLIVILE